MTTLEEIRAGTPALSITPEDVMAENLLNQERANIERMLDSKRDEVKNMIKAQQAQKSLENNYRWAQTKISADGSIYTVEEYPHQTSYNPLSSFNPTNQRLVINGRIEDPVNKQTYLPINELENQNMSYMNGWRLNDDGSVYYGLGYDDNGSGDKAAIISMEHNGNIITDKIITVQDGKNIEGIVNEETGFDIPASEDFGYSNISIETKTEEPEYIPLKTQKLEKNVIQYFGNGKDILSAINDAYKIVTDEKNIDKKTDYRVSLNVIPMNNLNNTYITEPEFNQRLGYVLGDSEGFLYKLYNKTAGLIFPYTPSITMNHSVNYEQTDISHSNLSIQNYQNTPPPSLSINAEFTADTKENAIYMVGAIWFFRSLTKMDFGLKAQRPGMPPPVLYLNGWGALINNIPVVISSFDVNLPKDKQYVSVQIGNTTQWVPTKLTMQIGLKIQPNIEKYKQQFDLQGYKRGDFGGLSDVNIGNVFLEESTKFKKITDVYNNYEIDKNGDKKLTGTSTRSSLESEKAYNARKTSGAGWTW